MATDAGYRIHQAGNRDSTRKAGEHREASNLVVHSAAPNPFIEGTCNIRLRRLSPAPHVTC